MKRLYAHYTFIYPDKYLENYVVELNRQGFILSYYPFEKEMANTEFFSGLQVFIPVSFMGNIKNEQLCQLEPRLKKLLIEKNVLIRSFSI